jgi:hypothetical protein
LWHALREQWEHRLGGRPRGIIKPATVEPATIGQNTVGEAIGPGGDTMIARQFKMAYWLPLLPLMAVAGAPPLTARIAIDGDELRVAMGWFWFRASVPLLSIVHARRSANSWLSVGVHTDMMGGWIVNGSPLGMVHLTIEPPAPGRFAGLPIQVSNLWLSPEEPEALLAALQAANPGRD